MVKLVVNLNLTLDGVMQAPGRPNEDPRGAFPYGGWALPYFDPAMGQHVAEGIATAPHLLFGRRTYQDFYSVWPGRTDNPFSQVLDQAHKYVVSNSLRLPLPWQNSTLLAGDPAILVAQLKRDAPRDLLVLGSGMLVQALLQARLVDELDLSIHPLVLGTGRRLFAEGSPYQAFELASSTTSRTGVVLVNYRLKPAA